MTDHGHHPLQFQRQLALLASLHLSSRTSPSSHCLTTARCRPPERQALAPRRLPTPANPQSRHHSHRKLPYLPCHRAKSWNSHASTSIRCSGHEDTASFARAFSRSPPLPSRCRQISANTQRHWGRNGVRALALRAFDGSRPPPLPQFRLNSRNSPDSCVLFSPFSHSPQCLRRHLLQTILKGRTFPQVRTGNGAASADVIRSEAILKSHRRCHPRCSPHDATPSTAPSTNLASHFHRSESSKDSGLKLLTYCSSVLHAPQPRRRHCSRAPLSSVAPTSPPFSVPSRTSPTSPPRHAHLLANATSVPPANYSSQGH